MSVSVTVRLLTVVAVVAGVGCSRAVQDGSWKPARTVEFIVAAGPGGGSDQFARQVQRIVEGHKLMDAAITFTYKGGGSGSEAFVYAKGAGANPHKVVFATNNVWLLPLGTAVGYAASDLEPVAAMALDEFLLWVNAKAPYRDLSSFLTAARGGTQLLVAGTQAKDTDQVLVRQIEAAAGVAFTYIPFRSGSEASVQLAGSHVSANVNNPQENIGQWRAGLIRPLCVFSPTRLTYTDAVAEGRSWADIPTCHEAGLPIERYQMPRTVWLPSGVTAEQVEFYRDLMAKVRATSEWKEWLRSGSQSDVFMSGAELAQYIASDERGLREQFTRDGWLVNN